LQATDVTATHGAQDLLLSCAPVKRSASAVWFGAARTGDGMLMSHSGALDRVPYQYASRFTANPGTSPEELLAAAHAMCFTMTLCAALSDAGLEPERLATQALVSFAAVNGLWTITSSHLEIRAAVGNLDAGAFADYALAAKNSCPISRALSVPITLDAQLDLRRIAASAALDTDPPAEPSA
jgi:osmotically inducible protein OsmC